MDNTLFLRLEGPLQAWGERGQWSVRDTAPEPTKSGVVGLLACALGLAEDKPIRELARALRMGVRCDRPGEALEDYHIVGGGYDEPMLRTAEGKPKLSSGEPHTEQTWRSYLQDASFLVALQGPPEVIDRLAEGVQNPKWPFFLGRMCCSPSRPPFDGTGDYPDLETALVQHEPLPGMAVRLVLECDPRTDGAVRRRDQTDSRNLRTFQPRYTCEKLWPPPANQEAAPCTSPA